MSWANLSDLFVSTGGGVIDGNVTISGELTQSKFLAVRRILTYSYKTTTTVTYADNWTQRNAPSCYLIGNQLRCFFGANRSSAIGTGNITNEVICTFSVDTSNRVSSFYNTTFVTGGEGGVASFYTCNSSVDDNGIITFDISINATASSSSAYTAYFTCPVTLNINAYS